MSRQGPLALFLSLSLAGLFLPPPLWAQPREEGGAAEELLEEAEALFEVGEDGKALLLLERAARLAPRSYRAQKLLGLELLIRSRHREAAPALRRAMALRPPSADRPLLIRALAWAEAGYRGPRAQELLFQAAEDEGSPLFHEGLALYYAGQLGAARAAFARAAAEREDPRPRYFLGLTNFRLGRYPEAERHLVRALKLSPTASYREAIAATLSRVRIQVARRGSPGPAAPPGRGAALPEAPPRGGPAAPPTPKAPEGGPALGERRLAELARELFSLEARLKTLRPAAGGPEEMRGRDDFRERYRAAGLAAMGEEDFRRFLAREKGALARRLLGEVRRRLAERQARHREYYPELRAKLEAREREGRELVERGERLLATAEGNTDHNREVLEHNRRAVAQVREQQAALARYLADYQRYLEGAEEDLRQLEGGAAP